MDIVGTRGFKGDKTVNARTQFNSLFDVVDQSTSAVVNSDHTEDFSADEIDNLNKLEHEQT
jgi:hypothetical protein